MEFAEIYVSLMEISEKVEKEFYELIQDLGIELPEFMHKEVFV